MCGRFALFAKAEELERHFQVPLPFPIAPRYNIAPTQPLLALATAHDTPQPYWTHFQWGLVPRWAKDPSIGNKMINARAESLAEKPAFRVAFRYRQCIVPISGFYEWAKTGRLRQPYFVRSVKGEPLGVAGLWESWQSPDGSELTTCTLITTDANATMQPIHHRMPAILLPEEYTLWLAPDTPLATLAALLRPAPEGLLEAYPVSTRVNNPAHDDPSLVEPVVSPPGLLEE